jgi:hypothetical protein
MKNGRWEIADGRFKTCRELTCGLKTKNPAGFAGEQGSRKIGDLEKIVNYLPTSLVRL